MEVPVLGEIRDVLNDLNQCAFKTPSNTLLTTSYHEESQESFSNHVQAHYLELPSALEHEDDVRNCISNMKFLRSVLNCDEGTNLDETIKKLWNECSELLQVKKDRNSDIYMENRIQRIQEQDEKKWEKERSIRLTKIEELECRIQQKKILLAQRTEEQRKCARNKTHINADLKLAIQELSSIKQKYRDLCSKYNVLKLTIDNLGDRYDFLNQSNNHSNLNDDKKMNLTKKVAKMRDHMNIIVSYKRDQRPVVPVLHILFQNEGKMSMSDLKREMKRILSADEENQISRQIYSLVASKLILIDRSHVDPVVKSLILNHSG